METTHRVLRCHKAPARPLQPQMPARLADLRVVELPGLS
jgi:hypothetical protein